jgi:hypothetical protein
MNLRVVSSLTNYTILDGDIVIFTYYNDSDTPPNIIQMLIEDYVGSLDGTDFIENELLAILKNYPSLIDVQLNSGGDLLIIGNDALQYSINSNGELTYTI